MKSFIIDSLFSGGIIVNYQCSSACAHCLYACSPAREKGYMTVETAATVSSLLKEHGCHSVHIGGGEPLLQPDALCKVLDVLADCAISVEYVETNCSWATSDLRTEKIIKSLMDHGLHCLLVSIDPFHNEFIPYEKVQRVMKVSEQEGMRVFPWQMEFEPDLLSFDTSRVHAVDEYASKFGQRYPMDTCLRYGVTFGGRAAGIFRKYEKKKPAEEIIIKAGPCERLTSTSHFHVDFNGRYIPALCTGFSIPLEEIGKPLDKYPILTMLYSEGIASLYTYATKNHGYKPLDSGYVNSCDLCLDIRKHLYRTGVDFPELAPAGFYREIC